jgi:Uncharacterised nucleotidyltransferase
MLPIEKIMDTHGPSMAVVIQACRVFLRTADQKDLDALIASINPNWKEIAILSKVHRIRPVVFRVLMESITPTAIKEQLKKELQLNTLQNFTIASETERLIDLLAKANISAIPYKGVAYSQQFYGDISMRESSDIDLVIDPNDLPKTFKIFEQDGYHVFNLKRYTSLGQQAYTDQEKDLCYDKITSGADNFHVELHYMITHPRFGAPKTINQFDLSGSMRSVLNGGAAKFLLPAEHFRAITLHHLLHDGLEYLKIFIDLAVGVNGLTRHVDLTTDHANSSTKTIRTAMDILDTTYRTNAIFLAMEQLFGVGTVLVKNKNKVEEDLADKIVSFNLNTTTGRYKRHRVFSLLSHYKRSINNRARLIRDNKQRRKFQKKYWINLFMPQQADEEAVPLPGFLTPFYFLIRPIRILLRKKSD